MQTDPVGSKDELNLYSYASGDALNATDPTGENAIGLALVVGGTILIGACAAEVVCTREQKQDLAKLAGEVARGLGELLGNILNSESSEETTEGEGTPTTPEELASKGTPGRETTGRTEQTDMPESQDPESDFGSLGGGEVETHEGGVKTKTISSGETAVYRPETESRGAQIAVQTKNPKGNVVRERKYRYPKRPEEK